jgi:hypothetical protein
MLKSRFLKQWVKIWLMGDEGYIRVLVFKMGYEAGKECYVVRYEDGVEETIFVDSVFRIIPVNPKKIRPIDFEKRRRKRLKLVRSG